MHFVRPIHCHVAILGLLCAAGCSADDSSTGSDSDTTAAESSGNGTDDSVTGSPTATDNGSTAPGSDTSDATTAAADGTTLVADSSTTQGDDSVDDSSTTGGDPNCHPLIVEVFFDAEGGDDLLQWVKLWNPCGHDIALEEYTLGWGSQDYAFGVLPLTDSIAAGGCFITGGPDTSAQNGDPDFDFTIDYQPNLETGEVQGGGVALFRPMDALIDPSSIPLDSVIYGPDNLGGLLDETGTAAAAPYVGASGSGGAIQRTDMGHGWQVVAAPTPAVCPLF